MNTESPPKLALAADPARQAGALRHVHAINSITLELNAVTDVRSHDEGVWASVVAIHNLFRGKNHPGKPLPILVRFGGNAAAYVLSAMKKGAHFTVTGRLDYEPDEHGKDGYRISAEQIRIHSRQERPPVERAA